MGLIKNYAQLARINAGKRRMKEIVRRSQKRYEERTGVEVIGAVQGRGMLLRTAGSHPWREPNRYYLATSRGWRKLNEITGEYYEGIIQADEYAAHMLKRSRRIRLVTVGVLFYLASAYALLLVL